MTGGPLDPSGPGYLHLLPQPFIALAFAFFFVAFFFAGISASFARGSGA